MNPNKQNRQPATTRKELDEHFARARENTAKREHNHTRAWVGGTLAVLALGAGYHAADTLTYKDIGTATSTVDKGETVSEAVEAATVKLAEEQGIDPSEIGGIVSTAQSIGGDVQPGYTVTVDLEENILGKHRVSPHEAEE